MIRVSNLSRIHLYTRQIRGKFAPVTKIADGGEIPRNPPLHEADFEESRVSGRTGRACRVDPEICPARVNFIKNSHANFFEIVFSFANAIFRILKYRWIETELVQRWYSISPTLLNFRIFRNLKISEIFWNSSKLNVVRGKLSLQF